MKVNWIKVDNALCSAMTRGTSSDNEWQRVLQQMITSDNKWKWVKQVTKSGTPSKNDTFTSKNGWL